MVTKLIVTIEQRLVEKYGDKITYVKSILHILSNQSEDVVTKLLYLDNSASMESLGLSPLLLVTNEKECKDKIDEVYRLVKPDFLVIFGSQDVVPFQSLANPHYPIENDSDIIIPTDLPYASENSYSKHIINFLNPTRLVGRIPDIPGAADVDYIYSEVNSIVSHKPVETNDYSYVALACEDWSSATVKILDEVFKDSSSLILSPPALSPHVKENLAALIHFINYHGEMLDTHFYGQRGRYRPVALTSSELRDNITHGTVVMSLCCYGAELFRSNIGIDSIAVTYLQQKAIAFIGSGSITYTSADRIDRAGLFSQYLLQEIKKGKSTGYALLQACKAYIKQCANSYTLFDLKTIAQFYLLGDPSLCALKTDSPLGAIDFATQR